MTRAEWLLSCNRSGYYLYRSLFVWAPTSYLYSLLPRICLPLYHRITTSIASQSRGLRRNSATVPNTRRIKPTLHRMACYSDLHATSYALPSAPFRYTVMHLYFTPLAESCAFQFYHISSLTDPCVRMGRPTKQPHSQTRLPNPTEPDLLQTYARSMDDPERSSYTFP